MAKASEQDLKRQIAEIRADHPELAEDAAFVAWFLMAYLVDGQRSAVDALMGASRDKGIDAIVIEDNARAVFLVQGKYRKRIGASAEGRNDVMSFAALPGVLWGDEVRFGSYLTGLDELIAKRLRLVRERLRERGYRLELIYVTLGSCSSALTAEAQASARRGAGRTDLAVIDGRLALAILDDYLSGVAPPIPSLDLRIEAGGRAQATGASSRFDPDSQIESWVFSSAGSDIAELFKKADVRIFARNIRGYLGTTDINRAMAQTIEKQPTFFWYFNNGVTIVCNGAEKIEQGGQQLMRMSNPQIINGQQTTRVLSESAKAAKASVLVRVITVPREPTDRFESLVSQIVQATNWQNQIKPSDLMSNDRRQIELGRQLRQRRYLYLRKRQTKGEARRSAGSRVGIIIKKDEFAQAVAACEFDPRLVRAGKEALFAEPLYASIFGEADAEYYLARYWLMRHIAYRARGKPEWAYAKWLALHQVWNLAGPSIWRRHLTFRRLSEANWDDPATWALHQLIDRSYRAVMMFYRRTRRGTGHAAQDVSTFFYSSHRHTEFTAWLSQEAKLPAQLAVSVSRFVEALERASA